MALSMTTGKRSRPAWLARLRAMPAAWWAKVSFTTVSAGAFAAFLLLPTYPIYDSEYYLYWGRQILHGQTPSFTIYDAPTEHPLGIAFGTVLAIFGNAALRLEVLAAIVSFLLIGGGMYRLTRIVFTPFVGAVAVALLLTRFNFEFLAARGYIDVAYAAAIVWAAALEVEKPRRGTLVFVLLLAAELIRPDAWLLGGLYWLWCAPSATWPTRLRWAALVAAGPVIWVGLDAIVTGQPLYSLHRTQDVAVALGRTVPLAQLPSTTWRFLETLIKAPVLGGAVAGLALSAWFVPRRMVAPAVILVTGIGTFVVLAAAGLSVIDRYLLMPSVILLIFCAYALSGWTMLEPGTLRRVWQFCAAGLAAFGIYFVAISLSVNKIATELGFRDDSHTSLVALLKNPAVRAGLRCGPVEVPDHKLRPDVMFLLNVPPSGVVDRNEARHELAVNHNPTLTNDARYGVAIYPLGLAVSRSSLVSTADDPLDQASPPGWTLVDTTQYYAAYVHCRA